MAVVGPGVVWGELGPGVVAVQVTGNDEQPEALQQRMGVRVIGLPVDFVRRGVRLGEIGDCT